MEEDRIIVVDLGGQYAHLIARRVRELGVFSEIVQPDAPVSAFRDAKGIILSGSPYSICDLDAVNFNNEVFSLEKPLLGICYGHQIIARENGGEIKSSTSKEFGFAEMKVLKKEGIFEGLDDTERIWMSHHDEVSVLPPGAEVIGATSDCGITAMADFEKNWYGVQFHPEVVHTKHGAKMLENFVLKICKCRKTWGMEHYIEDQINEIRKTVGDKKVFILASGGVDSTVTIALLHKALGKERIYALHVDTGFMRKNEAEDVQKGLADLGLSEFHIVDAGDDFFSALKGVIDPEKKREIIGNLFIEVKNKEIKKLGFNEDEWLLGQGTIYPDTIETAGTKHADRIKTHHNRVELVQDLIKQGKIIEPLSQLYKDEVRELGEKLGLPAELVWRHPFPGPGLAIRALCSDGKEEGAEYFEKIEEKAAKVIAETCPDVKFTVKVLPVKSVGVQGDMRTYRHPVAIFGDADWETIEKVSTSLTNSLGDVNRVVWAISGEGDIGEFKLQEADLNRERIEILQEADAVVNEAIKKHDLAKKIWQFPVVIVPLDVNNAGESIVLRPVESKEAMTVSFYPMQREILNEIANKLLGIEGVGAVFYDVTHKPPATIEWE